MARRLAAAGLAIALILLTSCQRAQQYPALEKKAEAKEEPKVEDSDRMLRDLSWREPSLVRDTPIVFVAANHPEWAALKAFWNAPPFPEGMPTVHIGHVGVEIAAAWALLEKTNVVKIKVPRGLEDPTKLIPAANPPTLGKWKLGKTLFFTPIVKTRSRTYSCATCHDPRHAFAADPHNPAGTHFSVPSLVNVVYHRRQFWDGRALTLEETLFRSFEDERKADADSRLEKGLGQHIWGGWVRELAEKNDKELNRQFVQVFGIEHPTQAAVAQALATYLRTILSADSLYDQADRARQAKGADKITATLFEGLLKNEYIAQTLRDNAATEAPKRAELAELWAKGNEVFHGNGRCALCHRGPLFSDHDFHNTGCDEKENWPEGNKETGRAATLPPGLKEARLLGAFRTPSLRNLKDKHAFFHSGSKTTLYEVVEFYNSGVNLVAPNVAKEFKDAGRVRMMYLSDADKLALVVFLRSLQGQPLDPMLTAP